MALPTTTRGSSIVEKTPTSADVQAAMFQTPEAADYLLQRLTTRLEGLGWMEKAQDVWERIREYDDVINQLAGFRSDCWAGSLETPFHNMHKKLAQDARKSINEAVKDPIKLDYALNKNSQFVCAFSVDGKRLTGKLQGHCNTLFNAWLVDNNLITRDGQIFEATDTGELEKLVDPDKLEQLIKTDSESTKSFQTFLKQHQIELNMQQHAFPEQAPVTKTAAEIKEVIREAQEEQKQEVQADVSASKPTKGGGDAPQSGAKSGGH